MANLRPRPAARPAAHLRPELASLPVTPIASSSELVLAREGRRPASTFVGIALGALGVVPLIAPGEASLLRTLVAAGLLTVAAAMIRRRGRTELTLSVRERTVSDGERSVPFSQVTAVALLGGLDLPLERSGVERYRVLLALEDGTRLEAFVDEDPAVAAQVAGRLSAALAAPVLPGWSLPGGAEPWIARGGGGGAGALELRGEVRPASRRVAASALVGGGIFTLLIARWTWNHTQRSGAPSAMSLGLAAGLLGAIFVTGLAVLRHRTLVLVDASRLLVRRQGLLGSRTLLELPRTDIGGAWPVTAGADTHHLLLQTSGGPRAFRLEASAGADVARALGR